MLKKMLVNYMLLLVLLKALATSHIDRDSCGSVYQPLYYVNSFHHFFFPNTVKVSFQMCRFKMSQIV